MSPSVAQMLKWKFSYLIAKRKWVKKQCVKYSQRYRPNPCEMLEQVYLEMWNLPGTCYHVIAGLWWAAWLRKERESLELCQCHLSWEHKQGRTTFLSRMKEGVLYPSTWKAIWLLEKQVKDWKYNRKTRSRIVPSPSHLRECNGIWWKQSMLRGSSALESPECSLSLVPCW